MPERDCFCAYELTPVMCPEHGVVRGDSVPDKDGNSYILYGDQAAKIVK